MKRYFALLAALTMIAALFIGAANPPTAGLIHEPWDKVAHLLFFFLLGVLLRYGLTLPAWVIVLLVAIVGAADEWHQYYVPGRTASVGDWLADLAGVVLAMVVLRGRGTVPLRGLSPLNKKS